MRRAPQNDSNDTLSTASVMTCLLIYKMGRFTNFVCFVLFCCYFFGPLLLHMEVPRLGVELEL